MRRKKLDIGFSSLVLKLSSNISKACVDEGGSVLLNRVEVEGWMGREKTYPGTSPLV